MRSCRLSFKGESDYLFREKRGEPVGNDENVHFGLPVGLTFSSLLLKSGRYIRLMCSHSKLRLSVMNHWSCPIFLLFNTSNILRLLRLFSHTVSRFTVSSILDILPCVSLSSRTIVDFRLKKNCSEGPIIPSVNKSVSTYVLSNFRTHDGPESFLHLDNVTSS